MTLTFGDLIFRLFSARGTSHSLIVIVLKKGGISEDFNWSSLNTQNSTQGIAMTRSLMSLIKR